jgi:hypothetical protein
VSSSYLRDLLPPSTPAKAQHKRTHPRDSSAFAFGRAAHAHIVDPKSWADAFAVEPVFENSARTKLGKDERAEFAASIEGRQPVSHADYVKISAMYRAVCDHGAHASLTGAPEVSVVWDDPASGIRCKARPDVLTGTFASDYKTTRLDTVDAGKWSREMTTYRYHFQAAMYLEGLLAADGVARSFRFVPQSKIPPYPVAHYDHPYSDPWLEAGRTMYRKALEIHRICTATGSWPGHPNEPQALGCPPWVMEDADAVERKAIDVW